jgi:hypothetical protein
MNSEWSAPYENNTLNLKKTLKNARTGGSRALAS